MFYTIGTKNEWIIIINSGKLNLFQWVEYFCTQNLINMALEFTDNNWDQEVINSDTPVLVDFWAEWCGPCRMIGPIVEEISGEYEGKLKVGKLNVDFNSNVAAKYGIRSIPTLLVFSNGEVVDKMVGAVPKAVITQKVENHLS
jgi:thioredoxin 1